MNKQSVLRIKCSLLLKKIKYTPCNLFNICYMSYCNRALHKRKQISLQPKLSNALFCFSFYLMLIVFLETMADGWIWKFESVHITCISITLKTWRLMEQVYRIQNVCAIFLYTFCLKHFHLQWILSIYVQKCM